MVLKVFQMDEVLLPSSCAELCFVDISSILEHISWCCFIFLAINNSSWSNQVFLVVLDVLHLLNHNFPIEFVLESSDCWICKSFHLYILLNYLSMFDHHLSLVPFILLVFWCCFSRFFPIIWFLLLSSSL